jgi:outer membrane protein
MKKALVIILALMLTSIGSTFAQQKFGYCNSVALLSELPEVKQADSDLQAFQTQLQKKGQEMIKELQDKATELQRKQDAGLISPKDYETQATKLKEEEENINKYAQEVDQKLREKREMLYKPILDRVNKAMQDVATEGQYFMVFDTSTQVLLYADETLDVTKAVKAKLGIQ